MEKRRRFRTESAKQPVPAFEDSPATTTTIIRTHIESNPLASLSALRLPCRRRFSGHILTHEAHSPSIVSRKMDDAVNVTFFLFRFSYGYRLVDIGTRSFQYRPGSCCSVLEDVHDSVARQGLNFFFRVFFRRVGALCGVFND